VSARLFAWRYCRCQRVAETPLCQHGTKILVYCCQGMVSCWHMLSKMSWPVQLEAVQQRTMQHGMVLMFYGRHMLQLLQCSGRLCCWLHPVRTFVSWHSPCELTLEWLTSTATAMLLLSTTRHL
jgi:hypothetical protein